MAAKLSYQINWAIHYERQFIIILLFFIFALHYKLRDDTMNGSINDKIGMIAVRKEHLFHNFSERKKAAITIFLVRGGGRLCHDFKNSLSEP